jgi:hypothetical protein
MAPLYEQIPRSGVLKALDHEIEDITGRVICKALYGEVPGIPLYSKMASIFENKEDTQAIFDS